MREITHKTIQKNKIITKMATHKDKDKDKEKDKEKDKDKDKKN